MYNSRRNFWLTSGAYHCHINPLSNFLPHKPHFLQWLAHYFASPNKIIPMDPHNYFFKIKKTKYNKTNKKTKKRKKGKGEGFLQTASREHTPLSKPLQLPGPHLSPLPQNFGPRANCCTCSEIGVLMSDNRRIVKPIRLYKFSK